MPFQVQWRKGEGHPWSPCTNNRGDVWHAARHNGDPEQRVFDQLNMALLAFDRVREDAKESKWGGWDYRVVSLEDGHVWISACWPSDPVVPPEPVRTTAWQRLLADD